jgi:cardiolipin synthase
MAESVASSYRWLRTGEEALAAMLDAISAAQKHVRLEIYTFAASPLGEHFRDALVQARQRGARVQVLLDAVGSLSLPESFWEPLTSIGGEFRWFNPLRLGRLIYRDHRKLLVCDEWAAFIGGYNIAPEYQGDGITMGWRDLGLRITGRLVGELAGTFDDFFSRADFKHKLLQRLRRSRSERTKVGENWSLLLCGPGRRQTSLKRTLANDLARARRVQIICAYFLPTWRIRKELRGVVRRGGKVQLILAGKSDVKLSQLASRRLYRLFLRAGVEIYEYQPQVLHAKLLIVDDAVYVGSANLDARSLSINYELQVRLEDRDIAAEAGEIFADDLKHCRPIERRTWAKSRNVLTKLLEELAYFVLARLDPYVARWRLKSLR